jgi:HEAT repeat protein
MKLSIYYTEEILRLLDEPTDDRRFVKHQIIREAFLKDIIQALRISKSPLTRSILCDILRYRYRNAKTAIPVLIDCLDDPNWKVRSDAAEALSKIGGLKAGKALLDHFEKETLPAYAFGLGEIGYRDAIPALTNALTDVSRTVRAGAASSLGVMHASEAKGVLIDSLQKEKDEWVLNYIKKALDNIGNAS